MDLHWGGGGGRDSWCIALAGVRDASMMQARLVSDKGGKDILQGHHEDLQSRVLENEQVEFLLRIYIMEKEGRKIGVKKR